MWPSRCMAPTALICLTLCSACGGTNNTANKSGGSSGSATALGAPEKTINARWKVDPASAACTPENLDLTCRYLVHGVHVTVSFNQQGHAEQIVIDGQPHSSMDLWHFLNSMVPPRSHQLSCRFVPHSSGGGTAHACLYQGSSPVIVAYFPHPNDPAFGGLVTYDYALYRDIKPEDTSAG